MGMGPEDDNVLDDPLDDDVGGALGDAPLVDEEVSSALSEEPLADEEAGESLADAPTVDEDDAEVSSALTDDPLVDEEVTSALADDEPIVKKSLPRGLDVGRGLSASTLDDPDLMDEDFAPAEPIEDELLTSVGDVPLVDPVEHRAPADGSRGLTRALWFFGIVVTALAALQTAQMFVARPAVERVERSEPAVPPVPVAPAAAPRIVAPPPPPPAAGRTPAEAIDRTLLDSRVQLSRGLYEQVRRILEPLAEDPQLLDANQRFEAYLLLAKAHRALGNVEKAQQWSLKATDQAIDRREPAQVFEEASTLSGEGRHGDARRVLHQLLARADALPEKEAEYRLKAQVRVADAWWGEAVRSGAFAPLPGLDATTEPKTSKPREAKGAKDAKTAEEKR
jgi:tetratricopeptide (TPR) repeat protein